MTQSIDLSSVYQLRSKFTIIGITGRTCSGCTTIARQLEKGFGEGEDYPAPSRFTKSNHNSYRKYRIIYNFAKENFNKFELISYKDVLTLFILKNGFEKCIQFLRSDVIRIEFAKSKFKVIPNFSHEISELEKIEQTFNEFGSRYSSVNFEKIKEGDNLKKLHDLFFSKEFKDFSSQLHFCLGIKSLVKRNKVLQIIANNIRRNGDPYSQSQKNANHLFDIVELINDIIKAYGKTNYPKPTKIAIDSLRNPLEIMFFKQRFSAFYVLAVNREIEDRNAKLRSRYNKDYEDIMKLLDEEYKGGKGNEFYKQYVRDCIEKADIHITYRSLEESEKLNDNRKDNRDNTSPYFSWQMQLLKYVSLIEHPGLVTPSPEERCMQMAYTAKYNSGCISRQVGATITDEFYSIKAIGWNNTPEGQVPCSLRNAEDLLTQTGDLAAFTPYEKTDAQFKETLEQHYKSTIAENKNKLKGRNVCFCFKSLKNSCSEGKNQVHTRSLHAEESAFLQITKYGGTGVKDGKLFTTASPCELCSKKAYQLGIKVIYYIDPYPGISQKQILSAGVEERNPNVRLFNGAIGSCYHWLYEPFMAYKDELSLILGQEIKDLTSKLEEQVVNSEQTITTQKQTIQLLENKIKELEGKNE